MSAPKLLALVALLLACSSEEATPAGDAGPGDTHVVIGGSVRFSVNGVARADNHGAIAVREEAGTVFNSVAATFPDGATLSMSWTGTDTGTITTDMRQLIMIWIQPDQTSYVCGAGIAGSTCTVTLASYDQQVKKRVAGNFSGTLAISKGGGAPLAITGGVFDLP